MSRGNRGPWWVTEVLVPSVIVLLFFIVYGLAGGLIGG